MDVYKKDSKYLNWCIEKSKNQIHDIKLFMDKYIIYKLQKTKSNNNKK